MRKYKQFICSLLIFSMIFSLNLNVRAENVNTEKLQIISALQDAEYIKTEMGLGDVDFADISVSNPIHSYEYLSTGIAENDMRYYPLKVNNKLIAWAIECENDNNITYQISTALIEEVSSIANDDLSFALIFDYDSSYLYDGTNICFLRRSSIKNEDRAVLQSAVDIPMDSNIELYNMKNAEHLGYTSPIRTRALSVYKCDVKVVSQNPPSNMCWAASIACIVNCKNGKSLTAVDVAKKYYGSTSYNKGLRIGAEADILNNTYNLPYTYKNQTASIKNITYNVQNNSPIFGSFTHSNGSHAVVIYGINTANSTIYIMDPEYGFCTAAYNAGYHYVSGYSGVALTFSSATCRSWVLY